MEKQLPNIIDFTKKKKFTFFDYLNTYSSTPKFTARDYNEYVENYNKCNEGKLSFLNYNKPKNYFKN